MSPPIRVLLVNLAIALGVGLPVAVISGAVAYWLFPPEWSRGGPPGELSLGNLAAALLFWYVILFLPVLVLAFLHQVVLAAFPHEWSRRRTRLAIVASALAVGGVVAVVIGTRSADVNVPALVTSLIPPVLCYGALARAYRDADDADVREGERPLSVSRLTTR